MKRDWKKEEKNLYLPKEEPDLVMVPSHRFFVIDGKGNPNDEAFSQAVGALYGLSWTIRMMHRSGTIPQGHYEYAIYPLEGLWSGVDDWDVTQPLDKEKFVYRVMIRQPEFVTEDVFAWALENAKRKKPELRFDGVCMEDIEDGRCIQMLHCGPYDDEPQSFARMDRFAEENGLARTGHTHREIYLGDPRKQAPEKLKTVLRYFVK